MIGHKLQLNIETIPKELMTLPQWVAYRLVWNGKRNKNDKIPYQINGEHAKTNDPNTWTTFQNALKAANDNGFDGIGFVFTKDDPYCGVDFDSCLDEAGSITKEIRKFITLLNSYAEYSPSGTGLHIIVKGKLPNGGRKKDNFECYDEGRFFTVTGRHLDGTPVTIEERQEELDKFHLEIFGQQRFEVATRAPAAVSLSEDEIIAKAKAAKNGDKFSALWGGNIDGYTSPSEADLALCSILAYWTNNNAGLIDAIFRRSGLYREKWDKVHHGDGKTYGQGTIDQATSGCSPTSEQKVYNLTDLGNTERLTSSCIDRLRYCHQFRKWLVWNDKFWEIDAVPEVYQLAMATVRGIYAEATAIEDKESRAKIAQHALKSESEARIRAMVSLAEKQKGISVKPEQLDKDPWLLNVLSGTIDLRTMKLRPHSQDDLITKLVPANFNPNAKCPKWIGFLNKITLNNQGLIRFLQRIVGYCLTGRTGEHKLLFFFGSGANGKTTFIKAIQGIMGNYAIKTDSELLIAKPAGAHSTDRADLKGCRLAITIEIQEGRHMAEAMVKELTGSDSITARKLYENNQTFEPTHKIILAANHKPVVSDTTIALWRRIDLIPFNYRFTDEERVKDYHEILLDEERDGIFMWALEGCREWQKIGLMEPPEVLVATKEYKTESDILEDFIADCCIVELQEEVTNKELRGAYKKWCQENGEKEISSKAFSQRLQEKGFIRDKSGSKGRYWHGLGISAALEATQGRIGADKMQFQ